MKHSLVTIICLMGMSAAKAQLTIQSNTVFKSTGGVQIVVQNMDINNQSGQTDFSNAVLLLKGTTNTALNGGGAWNVRQLQIDKGSGKALLGAALQVSEKVEFLSGKLDLNNQTLTLGADASLQNEDQNHGLVGPNGGTVQITKTLNAPAAINAGNLGAVITSGANLGAVTIRRMHKVPSDNDSKKAKRYYEIVPANNNGLNATLRLHYFDSELNGIAEGQLVIWKRNNAGSAWSSLGYTNRNTGSNYVEKTGQNGLYQYVLYEGAPGTAPSLVAAAPVDAKLAKAAPLASLAPVPATSTTVLSLQASTSGRAEVQVVTADGRVCLRLSKGVSAGANTITIDVSRLPAGAYFMQLSLPDGTTKALSLLKQ